MHKNKKKQQNLIYCDSQTHPKFILFLSIQLKSNLIPLRRYYMKEKHYCKKSLVLLVHKPYDR